MSIRKGLVFGKGPSGRCDDYRVGGAIVDYDEIGRAWRMWYYCRDAMFDGPPTLGTGRIALATSNDGIAWRRFDGPLSAGAVFEPSADPADFDSLHIGLTDISRGAGEWLMWYFGGDKTIRETGAIRPVAGLGMRPGLARSADGIHWHRVRGSHETGALFDYPEERVYAAWPNTFGDGRQLIVQYTAPLLNLARFETRVATSADGVAWSQIGALEWADGDRDYDAGGMVTRQVLANPLPGGRRFLMVYTATDAAHRRSIAAADSDDGFRWHRLYGEPIFHVGEPGAWDELGVAANRLVIANAQLHLYYYGFQSLGADHGERGIGLATATIGDLRRLRRLG